MSRTVARISCSTAANISLLHHDILLPPEGKVPRRDASQRGQAQPGVVRHEDQHEEVGQRHLDGVQAGLGQVQLGKQASLHGLDDGGGLVSSVGVCR